MFVASVERLGGISKNVAGTSARTGFDGVNRVAQQEIQRASVMAIA